MRGDNSPETDNKRDDVVELLNKGSLVSHVARQSEDGRAQTMWKASAVRASEWATKPLMSSRRKKAVSIPIIILIRVLLESADLDAMVGRVAVCAWQSQGGNDERTRHLGKKVCERERVEREEKWSLTI